MKRLFAPLFLAVVACGRDPKVPQQLLDAGITAAPDVIEHSAAVVFWLRDVDTLQSDSAVAAVQDVTALSQDLVDLLSDTDVAVYFTTRSRIYVRAQLAPRRVVTLNGLDFPWGVVFVEPGYAEQIVTGPVRRPTSGIWSTTISDWTTKSLQGRSPWTPRLGWASREAGIHTAIRR
jgi:hypothetical protein